MAGIFTGNIGQESLSKLVPWFLLAIVVLYFVGFVDGTVHGAAFGAAGGTMGMIHEFFHHARHVALMCH
jgi:hypothetical protein